MKNNQTKFILILILLLGVGSFSWSSFFKTYMQKDTVNIHLFPKIINGWPSEELNITDEEYAILETKNAFSRNYKLGPDKEVMLFIVYSQNNRKVSHPPELCYSGSGLNLISQTKENLMKSNSTFRVNELVFEYGKSSSKQKIFYWFKVGDSFTDSYWKQQILIAFKSLLHQSSSSALIRLSTIVKDPAQSEEATKSLEKFAEQIFPLLNQYLP